MSVERDEREILAVTSVAHFLAHFSLLVFPALALAVQGEWGLTFDSALEIGFWMYLLFGLGALPCGLLTDLWGSPRAMIVICLAGIGGCASWAAAASGPSQLRWALAGLGLFASAYHPAGMAWISVGIRGRGRALGVNGVAGNLGEVLAPFAAGLLAVAVGWRSVFYVVAAPALGAAVVALVLHPGRRTPSPHRAAAPTRSASRRPLAFALLGLAMMCGGIAYRGQTLVLPKWFQEQGGAMVALIESWRWLPRSGTHLVAATALTSLAYLAGALGQIWGGRLADRHDLRRVYFAFHAAGLVLLTALGSLSGPFLFAAAMAYAFFAFGMQPAENSLVATLTPPRLRSTGYGLKFILVFGVGSLAVKLVGAWQAADGLAAVFPRLGLFLAGLLASVLALAFATRGEPLRNDV